ncbi:N-acetylmuramidase domain-containing protein [Brucella sp.]|uniref:N-acetylmuramidase domain-containing protein n=1 Tax=Brucella sp. TaxID=52132 RepID=UPI0028ABCCC8|nr:N-acetylmuramidase domain-containing protein [Brucella sp.]
MLGTGRAEAITDRHIATLADQLGVHPADIEAISEVESNGFGWYPDGRIKILFEKHWFYKLIPTAKRSEAVKARIARKDWISPAKGGYKEQNTTAARYDLLAKAIRFNEDAAYQSISIGRYQIMGFNHAICGFATAKLMFEQFVDSEVNQLSAFAAFLKSKKLIPAIEARDFAKVEEVYNGGGLNGEYARKMQKASDQLRAGKWKGYVAGSMREPDAPATPETVPEAQPSNLVALIASLLGKLFDRWKGASK